MGDGEIAVDLEIAFRHRAGYGRCVVGAGDSVATHDGAPVGDRGPLGVEVQAEQVEQAADFVPLRKKVERSDDKNVVSADGHVPAELLDLTNKHLWEKFGLAIAGAIAMAPRQCTPGTSALGGDDMEKLVQAITEQVMAALEKRK